MAIRFEDIFSALCTEVQLQSDIAFQKVYLLGDAEEAELACEILTALEFDAKLYHEDNISRLYVVPLPPDAAETDKKLAIALAYAISLKQIQQSLDTLCSNHALGDQSLKYNLAFTGTGGDQQIIARIAPLQLESDEQQVVEVPIVKPSLGTSVAMQKSQSKHLVSKNKKGRRKPKKLTFEEEFNAGPTIGKKRYPRGMKPLPDNSLRRKIYLYAVGNMANMGITIFVLVIVPIIFALCIFVLSKTVLCPDFATQKRNPAWYCTND